MMFTNRKNLLLIPQIIVLFIVWKLEIVNILQYFWLQYMDLEQ